MPEPSPTPPPAPPSPRPRPHLVWRLLLAAVPGLLAGAHVAGLLFFLNPELPFELGPLLRTFGFYGALLGAVAVLLQLPGALRGRPPMRVLPWALGAVLLAAAVLDGAQASWYAFYLPSGINVRLLKAATWLGLGGLITLYTALVHSLPPRRYGPRSVTLLVLLTALSLYAVIERREAYQPRPEPTPLRSLIEGQRPLAITIVGIDAGTLDAVLPLAEQGRLPFLAELLHQGSYARLRSFTPTLEQPLWTTLATGKFPHRHGVRSETVYSTPRLAPGAELRLLPAFLGFEHWGLPGQPSRPTVRADRLSLSAWDVLADLGVPTGVVGWPLVTPSVRPLVFAVPAESFAGGGETLPAGLRTRVEALRIAPEAADAAALQTFGSPPARPAVRALSADLWRETLTTELLAGATTTRALFVRLPGLAIVSRRWFGGYVAHQLEGERSERSDAAAHLVAAYYTHLDQYLAGLWAREEGPHLLAVVSPHGAAAPGDWRRVLAFGRRPMGGVLTGRADGVLLLRGEGIRAGAFVPGAGIEDVVPTLLYGLGLPVARDMDGRVLTAAFEPEYLATHPLRFVPSYDSLTR